MKRKRNKITVPFTLYCIKVEIHFTWKLIFWELLWIWRARSNTIEEKRDQEHIDCKCVAQCSVTNDGKQIIRFWPSPYSLPNSPIQSGQPAGWNLDRHTVKKAEFKTIQEVPLNQPVNSAKFGIFVNFYFKNIRLKENFVLIYA